MVFRIFSLSANKIAPPAYCHLPCMLLYYCEQEIYKKELNIIYVDYMRTRLKVIVYIC